MFPDNPTPISLNMLESLERRDADKPGRWIAQPKMDGWRRCCFRSMGGRWTYTSKRQSAGSTIELPPELRSALERLALRYQNARHGGRTWPLALDCEWIGKRMVEHVDFDRLWIFDLLLPDLPFSQRLELLDDLQEHCREAVVQVMPHWSNPGLVERFQDQLTDPLSEGLVVRRADSVHLLGEKDCKVHPLVFKVKYRDVKERRI